MMVDMDMVPKTLRPRSLSSKSWFPHIAAKSPVKAGLFAAYRLGAVYVPKHY